MKFTILIGALALTATAFTPLAHASAAFGGLDKQCFKVLPKEWTSCNNGSGSNAKLPDFKLNMKSTKSRNNKTNNVGGGNNTNIGSNNNNDPDTGGEDPSVDTSNANPGTGNEGNGNSPGNHGNKPDKPNKPNNNTNPPQHNSNHIKGYDPFTDGLYGPGT